MTPSWIGGSLCWVGEVFRVISPDKEMPVVSCDKMIVVFVFVKCNMMPFEDSYVSCVFPDWESRGKWRLQLFHDQKIVLKTKNH